MTLVGWSLCQSHDTPMGTLPPAVDDRGVWEDWCQEVPNDRWEIIADFNAVFEAECASFGGRLLITGEGTPGSLDAGIQTTEPWRWHGARIAVRTSPAIGPWRDHTLALAQQPFPEALGITWTIWQEDGEPQIQARIGRTGANVLWDAAYDASAHEWLAVRFSPDGDTVWLETAPACGTWTVRATADISADAAEVGKLRLRLFSLFYGDQVDPPEDLEAGAEWVWSEIYVIDTNPEDEEPEEE